ncbi:MAG: helix-turn-helix domain-containing protein, partial [Oceanobacter sp.]
MIQELVENTGSLDTLEHMAIEYALEKTHGNISAAAGLLNMKRGQFDYR